MSHLALNQRDDEGASAVEYGLLLAAVAAVIVVVLVSFGGVITGMFKDSCDKAASATSQTCSTAP